jgi:hypothetical protein
MYLWRGPMESGLSQRIVGSSVETKGKHAQSVQYRSVVFKQQELLLKLKQYGLRLFRRAPSFFEVNDDLQSTMHCLQRSKNKTALPLNSITTRELIRHIVMSDPLNHFCHASWPGRLALEGEGLRRVLLLLQSSKTGQNGVRAYSY